MNPLLPRADVYFNLHRKIWSIRNLKTGLVETHARVVVFPYGASFVVRKTGHTKVLQTGVKNVHAFVRGETPDSSNDPRPWDAEPLPDAIRVTYNPRRADHFTMVETGERIDKASAVVMIARKGAAPEVWAVPE